MPPSATELENSALDQGSSQGGSGGPGCAPAQMVVPSSDHNTGGAPLMWSEGPEPICVVTSDYDSAESGVDVGSPRPEEEETFSVCSSSTDLHPAAEAADQEIPLAPFCFPGQAFIGVQVLPDGSHQHHLIVYADDGNLNMYPPQMSAPQMVPASVLPAPVEELTAGFQSMALGPPLGASTPHHHHQQHPDQSALQPQHSHCHQCNVPQEQQIYTPPPPMSGPMVPNHAAHMMIQPVHPPSQMQMMSMPPTPVPAPVDKETKSEGVLAEMPGVQCATNGEMFGSVVLFATAPVNTVATGSHGYDETVSRKMDIVWHGEFQKNFSAFAVHGHQWELHAMEEPPLEGPWHQFKDSAKVRFVCERCGNAWTSMKGRVFFWINLHPKERLGAVLFKLYGQACCKCEDQDQDGEDSVQFCHPMWYPEEVIKVIGNLYNRVGQLYYEFKRPLLRIDRRAGKMCAQRHHNTKRCQACKDGVCKFEWTFA